jgi:hypothetical protein
MPYKDHANKLACQARYRERNRESLRLKDKEYYQNNLEYERLRSRTRYYARREIENRRRYQDIWEQHFRVKIPEGYVIHHKDQDTSNNNPTNLLACPRSIHNEIHWMLGSFDNRAKKEVME